MASVAFSVSLLGVSAEAQGWVKLSLAAKAKIFVRVDHQVYRLARSRRYNTSSNLELRCSFRESEIHFSMAILKRWVWLAVIGLLVLQAALISFALHRESLTFDETDHMYAGYRMWTAKDYGLNPEH